MSNQQDELRSEQEIRDKLDELREQAEEEGQAFGPSDTTELAQIRTLRWALKESVSL